jgi:tetratricopeptide (TPR) repeat protein
MYPHLTPFGVIMKINRQELPSIPEEAMQKDHDFWKQYSKRMTGDIMDYDTPVKDVVAWIEKTYLRHDFSGFTGDRKFVRDEDAQKAFSKLRSSIGGVYAWRVGPQCPPSFRPKSEAESQRVYREADFAFKQAFAFCPFSPEAVWRYASLLSQLQRFDDAILVAETCHKLDPFNSAVLGLLSDLHHYKESAGGIEQARANLQRLGEQVRANPGDFNAAVQLAASFMQFQQTDRAALLLEGVLNNPKVDLPNVMRAAQLYAEMRNWAKVETALEKAVAIDPSTPENWYNLAALRASVGKQTQALDALRRTIELNTQRLKSNPKAVDLAAQIRQDQHFDPIRQTPEFRQLLPAK